MQLIIILLSVVLALALGALAASTPYYILIISVILVGISVIAFLSPKTSLVFLVFSMLLSPEINVGGLAGQERAVVFRYDDILLMVIFLSWFARTAIYKTKAFITETPVQRPMLLFTAVCVLSTSLGILRGEVRFDVAAFYLLKYVEYFLLYFMTVNIVETKEEARKYLYYGLFVAFVVTVYALYYYLNAGPGARASGPFEAPLDSPQESEPASLGGYYLIVFGLLLGLIGEVSGPVLLRSLGALALMMPVFMLTLSRSSYIGLMASLAALLVINRKRKLLLAVLLLVGFGALSLTPTISTLTKQRVESTYKGIYAVEAFETPFGTVKLETSAAMRVRTWMRSLFYWLPKHLVLGNGVTGVGLVDAQIPLVIGETGLLGLAAWLWMIAVAFRTSWRVHRKAEDPLFRGLALGYMVGLVGLLAQSVGVNTFIIVRIMEPFWFLTALMMVVYRQTVTASA